MVRREDLDHPPDLTGTRVRRRLIALAGVALAVVAVITLAPGLASLRQRLAAGDPGWLVLGAGDAAADCYRHDIHALFSYGGAWERQP